MARLTLGWNPSLKRLEVSCVKFFFFFLNKEQQEDNMNQVDKTHHFLKNPKQLSAASGKGAAGENKLFLFFQIRATHTSRPHGWLVSSCQLKKRGAALRQGYPVLRNKMATTNASQLLLLTQSICFKLCSNADFRAHIAKGLGIYLPITYVKVYQQRKNTSN